MIIRCPQCEHARSVNIEKIPPGAEMATCPKCKHRFRFRIADAARVTTEPPAQRATPSVPPAPPKVADIWEAVDSLHQRWHTPPAPQPSVPSQRIAAYKHEETESASRYSHSVASPQHGDAANIYPPDPHNHSISHSQSSAYQETHYVPHGNASGVSANNEPASYNNGARYSATAQSVPPSGYPAAPEPRDAVTHSDIPQYSDTPQYGGNVQYTENAPYGENGQYAENTQYAGSGQYQENLAYGGDPQHSGNAQFGGNAQYQNGPQYGESTQGTQTFAQPGADSAYEESVSPALDPLHDDTPPEERVERDLQMLRDTSHRPLRDLGKLDEHGSANSSTKEAQALPFVAWEDPAYGKLQGYMLTIRGVMFDAGSFFRHIQHEGALAHAYLFFFLQGFLAIGCSKVWGHVARNFLRIDSTQALLALPLLLLVTPLILGILQVIVAGCIKVMIHIAAPEKADFSAIFKVVGYSSAPLILSVIPFVGPIAGAVWHVLALMAGCRHTLDLSWPMAIGIPLIPAAAFLSSLAYLCW